MHVIQWRLRWYIPVELFRIQEMHGWVGPKPSFRLSSASDGGPFLLPSAGGQPDRPDPGL